jgi:hypothetical protein
MLSVGAFSVIGLVDASSEPGAADILSPARAIDGRGRLF